MCGIIGFTSKKVTNKDIEVLKKVLIESRIRGKHASGIAWHNGKNTILSVVEPIPIDELVQKFDFKVAIHNGQMSLIAHARYSTSNINYSQPIVNSENTLAIAHNGVITQDDPSTWKSQYGYECVTKNDSELLLRCLENSEEPTKVFPKASIAAITLTNKGKVSGFRNGIRPLWTGKVGEGIIFASTYDILDRAGVKDIKELNPSTEEYQRRNYQLWQKK